MNTGVNSCETQSAPEMGTVNLCWPSPSSSAGTSATVNILNHTHTLRWEREREREYTALIHDPTVINISLCELSCLFSTTCPAHPGLRGHESGTLQKKSISSCIIHFVFKSALVNIVIWKMDQITICNVKRVAWSDESTVNYHLILNFPTASRSVLTSFILLFWF